MLSGYAILIWQIQRGVRHESSPETVFGDGLLSNSRVKNLLNHLSLECFCFSTLHNLAAGDRNAAILWRK